uniref:Retrotransposon gag domain-containing protein n=1 Tax=Tanacetum cinerariifolium TaxID=118510 RepID=A0A699KH90_TANCI|nr:hypothetical protein [Tanacetum cinerariifolium]
MVTKLRNEITNFRQRPDESLFEAWERYKISIDHCHNHNMIPVTQIDTFYNGLTLRHRDTINAAVGETFMERRPKECYDLIENMTSHHNDWDTFAQRRGIPDLARKRTLIKSKSKVHQSRAKAVVAKVGTSSSTPAISSEVAELKDMVRALLLDKKNQSPAPTPSSTPALVKAVESNCVTCGGAHSYQNCPATQENAYRDNIQEYVSQAAAANYN